jgi:pyruvate formate-lyase activating enzyme-like uncharacterized protein
MNLKTKKNTGGAHKPKSMKRHSSKSVKKNKSIRPTLRNQGYRIVSRHGTQHVSLKNIHRSIQNIVPKIQKNTNTSMKNVVQLRQSLRRSAKNVVEQQRELEQQALAAREASRQASRAAEKELIQLNQLLGQLSFSK